MFVRGITVFRAKVPSPGETQTFRALPRTSGLARGKHPHSAHLCLARSPHPRRPQSFGNLPKRRPGFREIRDNWCLRCGPPMCVFLNTQLGRVSPYGYEASPHLISHLDPLHSFSMLWINLRTFRATLLSHPNNNNQLISEFGHSPDELHSITL